MAANGIPTLADLPRMQAARYGARTAFIAGERQITYAEFDASVNRVANGLIGEGVARGARVALLDKDSVQGFEVLFGSAKAGAVALGINWRLAAPEISYIINDAQAEILFVGREFFPKVEAMAQELKSVRKIIAISGQHTDWPGYEQWRDERAETDPLVQVDEQDVAVQMYTSGTTGNPKGVQLAHYSFFAVLAEMERRGINWIDWSEEDVNLLVIPSFHIGGLWWAVRGLAAGAKNVVMDAFTGWQTLAFIQRYRVTKTCLVPSMMQLMLVEPDCPKTDFSSLQYVVYGGSPIPLELLQQAMRTFNCWHAQIYGMTETGNAAVSLPPEDHDPLGNERMAAAGKPFPGVEVRVIDEGGNSVPPRTIGEICLKSPANMVGYWNQREATAKTLINGWIHTGDAGYLDQDGYVYICDRVKDMIIYAGENVYPAEVERAIYSHEAVAEVAVIGVPDQRWGESIKALVVLKPGASATAGQIIAHARRQIADFKAPKSVDFVDSLPHTASGKLRKGELRAPYWQGHERKVN